MWGKRTGPCVLYYDEEMGMQIIDLSISETKLLMCGCVKSVLEVHKSSLTLCFSRLPIAHQPASLS
jgi:hypothetical protein